MPWYSIKKIGIQRGNRIDSALFWSVFKIIGNFDQAAPFRVLDKEK